MRLPANGLSSGPSVVPAKIDAIGNLHGPEIPVSRKLLIEASAAVAMDAPIHFMLDEYPQVLIAIGPLFLPGSA